MKHIIFFLCLLAGVSASGEVEFILSRQGFDSVLRSLEMHMDCVFEGALAGIKERKIVDGGGVYVENNKIHIEAKIQKKEFNTSSGNIAIRGDGDEIPVSVKIDFLKDPESGYFHFNTDNNIFSFLIEPVLFDLNIPDSEFLLFPAGMQKTFKIPIENDEAEFELELESIPVRIKNLSLVSRKGPQIYLKLKALQGEEGIRFKYMSCGFVLSPEYFDLNFKKIDFNVAAKSNRGSLVVNQEGKDAINKIINSELKKRKDEVVRFVSASVSKALDTYFKESWEKTINEYIPDNSKFPVVMETSLLGVKIVDLSYEEEGIRGVFSFWEDVSLPNYSLKFDEKEIERNVKKSRKFALIEADGKEVSKFVGALYREGIIPRVLYKFEGGGAFFLEEPSLKIRDGRLFVNLHFNVLPCSELGRAKWLKRLFDINYLEMVLDVEALIKVESGHLNVYIPDISYANILNFPESKDAFTLTIGHFMPERLFNWFRNYVLSDLRNSILDMIIDYLILKSTGIEAYDFYEYVPAEIHYYDYGERAKILREVPFFSIDTASSEFKEYLKFIRPEKNFYVAPEGIIFEGNKIKTNIMLYSRD